MVLVYLGNGDTKILDVLSKLSIEYHLIGDAELSKTMTELVQNPTSSKGKQEPFLFLYKEDAQPIADAFQSESIFVPRVAQDTPENLLWTLSELMDEIDLAYKIDCLRNELMDMLDHISTKRFQSDAHYQHLVRHAIAYVEDPNASLEQLDDMVRALRD